MVYFNKTTFKYGNKYKFLLITIIVITCFILIQSIYFRSSSKSQQNSFKNIQQLPNKLPKQDIPLKIILENSNKIENLIKNETQIEVPKEQPEKEEKPAIDPNNIVSLLSGLEKLVHIDLKGAPPKADFFKEFIPFLKKYGASGLILEYEDMFPFKRNLEEVKHGNAYTINDIKMINQIAKENNLKLMPLVQTYGHLEWLLKNKKFEHLREHREYPQVITPCLDESYSLLFEMLDQVIELYNDVPYFHIGCDEVYYKLLHEKCENQFDRNFHKAFIMHVIKIASHIKSKIPNVKIIIWDDMLHSISEDYLNQHKSKLNELEIEPMIWAYVEDVTRWFQDDLYRKYGHIFSNVWAASAYKGADNELLTITSIQHHYLNHISWIKVIQDKTRQKLCNFKGIALTGWSRYDHFLQTCDLLPQAIPSLVYNLKTVQLGEMASNTRTSISQELGCKNQIPWTRDEVSGDYMSCTFPAHEVYEAILPINHVLRSAKENVDYARKYVGVIGIEYNYVHKARAHEVVPRLESSYQLLISFKNRFIEASKKYYWDDTIYEWLEVYFMHDLYELYDYLSGIKRILKENNWGPRPLPITIKNLPDKI